MATLADLIALRDRLKGARYAGVREVRDSNGESISYKSDGEMAKALAALDADIAAHQSHPRYITYPLTSKGI